MIAKSSTAIDAFSISSYCKEVCPSDNSHRRIGNNMQANH